MRQFFVRVRQNSQPFQTPGVSVDMRIQIRKLPPAVALFFVCLSSFYLSDLAHAQLSPLYTWSRSLPVDFLSPAVGTLGGTETRSLVEFDGKLFAGIGYWRDTEQDNPKLPGAQVLVLDSANSTWKVDLALDDVVQPGHGVKPGRRRYFAIGAMRSFTAHQDSIGRPLKAPVSFLFASVWDRIGGLRLFSRGTEAKAVWSSIDLIPDAPQLSQMRSFGTHIDSVTHREMFFAGANPGGVYAGTFDGSANFVHWNQTPETWDAEVQKDSRAQDRVMAFAECNGKLYATSGFQLFERQDGLKPAWKKIFVDSNPSDNPRASGYRGMTAISAADGGQELIIGVEAYPSRILRIDPRQRDANDMAKMSTDLDVSAFLTALRHTPTTYALPGYNDMFRVRLPGTNCDSLLIGFESTTPRATDKIGTVGKHPYAEYFVRRCDIAAPSKKYEVQRIIDPTFPTVTLTATRSITASPFHDDPPGTVYASGLDAGNITVHNTAWIYKGVPAK
jgi:hypothetical protein